MEVTVPVAMLLERDIHLQVTVVGMEAVVDMEVLHLQQLMVAELDMPQPGLDMAQGGLHLQGM